MQATCDYTIACTLTCRPHSHSSPATTCCPSPFPRTHHRHQHHHLSPAAPPAPARSSSTGDPYHPPDRPFIDISEPMIALQFPPLPTAGFSRQGEAVAYLQNHGQENVYALTVMRSIQSQQQVYYCCDQGPYQVRRSKPPSHIPEDHRKRKRTVSQTQCQYEVMKGRWDGIDIKRARELLGKGEYAGVCIIRVR